MIVNRTPFYGMAIFTAVLQSVFGTVAGFVNGRSPYLYVFGKLAGGLSVATWVWIGILFKFNHRQESSSPLCRSYAHFVSFVFLATVWLAVGIMLASQMPWECGAKTLWCAAASFSSALAFCTSLFSTGAAVIIYRSAARTGAGLSVNVAQIGKRELPVDDMM
ncbi:hypothetical protein HYPSUDRAFT_67832 [Hypholoma sublateritium FD-334 SS-4]|uniref:MARVEL domain-containing protein n=1 Tax=Hypholoma sublateritium (strain FD-334 SS-4) TaxID=945553 RepID=A0A0D2NRC0_HYPSF|nr:hypothetical protein HYPSUDRAFT_67832 [Hypholoma sublateritium FD-334 SS-4]